MEFGKFATAEELLKGYNQLEKSFTQKCQQAAALEKDNAELMKKLQTPEEQPAPKASGTSENSSPQEGAQSTTVEAATVPQGQVCDAQNDALDGAAPFTPTDEQLQQYLQRNPEVAARILHKDQPKAPNVMSGGGNVSLALPSRPKTIKEASLMAKDLFK